MVTNKIFIKHYNRGNYFQNETKNTMYRRQNTQKRRNNFTYLVKSGYVQIPCIEKFQAPNPQNLYILPTLLFSLWGRCLKKRIF